MYSAERLISRRMSTESNKEEMVYRLLIADDEQIERMVLYKTLQQHMADTCEIYQAENGREALALYEEKQIQIAILDIEMPGINGIEAAAAIRAKDPDCCIIFLTAYDEFDYARKAITVRALDYLLKPYEEEELLTVLESAFVQIEKNGNQRLGMEKRLGRAESSAGMDETADAEFQENTQENTQDNTQDNTQENTQLRMSMVAEIIESYLQNHYMEDISMQQVAHVMNYSEPYFSKLFKQCFSRNFTSYLTEYRVEKAKELLLQPMVNVKSIGESVGYPDSNYFAKVFRRYTGFSPTEYRLDVFQKQGGEQFSNT